MTWQHWSKWENVQILFKVHQFYTSPGPYRTASGSGLGPRTLKSKVAKRNDKPLSNRDHQFHEMKGLTPQSGFCEFFLGTIGLIPDVSIGIISLLWKRCLHFTCLRDDFYLCSPGCTEQHKLHYLLTYCLCLGVLSLGQLRKADWCVIEALLLDSIRH